MQVRGDVVGFERLAVDLDEEVGIAVAPRWQRDVIDGGTALTRTEVEACECSNNIQTGVTVY